MYCGAELGKSGKNCDYGTGKMTYHLLVERKNINAGEAMKMFQRYIAELRDEQSNVPLEDSQNGASPKAGQDNLDAAEDALRKLQESI